MFYSQSLLSRKGSLGNIWMAAYCFKRLRRDQIAGTDISSSIDKIKAEAQISYRVLAQLLLGIVRIFSRKVEYLYKDCEEALTHISRWTVPKEAVNKHQRGVAGGKEVIPASEQNVTASKEVIPVAPVETMRTPFHHVTITVPERFELDTFELEGVDEDNTVKPHEQYILQDELIEERNGTSFINECDYRETAAYAEFNYACFTPVNDVLTSEMMDIDLEISEFCNSSISEVRRQKPQRDFWQLIETDNVGPSLNEKEPEHKVRLLNLPETLASDVDKEINTEERKDQANPVKLHVEILSDHEKSHGLTEGHLDIIAQTKTSNKSSFPCDAGFASPKFTVTTPAKREQTRMLRKRKTFCDEIIVVSNETLRLGIHDASSLICRRRKLPHTTLDAWKACKVTNLQHIFMEPLIPFFSSDLKALFQKRFSDHTLRGNIVGSLDDEEDRQNDRPGKFLNVEGPLQEITSVETPVHAGHHEPSTPSKLDEAKLRDSSIMETSGSDLIDLELGCDEKGSNGQDDGWALRTRAMAQYLHNRFLNLREQEQKGILSLARILEGKTRTTCARFFYETLALKNLGCLGVKQGSPYDDIMISSTPQLEAMLRNQ